jgi:hypothetical protein
MPLAAQYLQALMIDQRDDAFDFGKHEIHTCKKCGLLGTLLCVLSFYALEFVIDSDLLTD